MPVLGAHDIAVLANHAGLEVGGQNLPVAVAVALAESGGNTDAHCLNCAGVKEDSRGLWQINLDAHPKYKSSNLYDPATNAAAMFEVSGSGGTFKPWSTFTNGRYLAYMPVAKAAVDQMAKSGESSGKGTGGVTDATPFIPDVPKSITSVVDAIVGAAGWVANPHNIIRVIEVIVGIGGLFLAFILLNRDLAGDVAKVAAV